MNLNLKPSPLRGAPPPSRIFLLSSYVISPSTYYIQQQSYDNLLFLFWIPIIISNDLMWGFVTLLPYPFLLITKCYRQFLGNRPLFHNLSWFFVYFKFIISFLSSSQESLVKIREHNWLGFYGKTQRSNANNNHGGELRFNNIKQILLTSHSFWIN